MRRRVRLVLGVVGLALFVGGVWGLVGGGQPPEVRHYESPTLPAPPIPASDDGRRPGQGTMVMEQVFHDGGTIGWLAIAGLGVGLVLMASALRSRSEPPANES